MPGVGFIGAPGGQTAAQDSALIDLVMKLKETMGAGEEFHVPMVSKSDYVAAGLAERQGWVVIGHPLKDTRPERLFKTHHQREPRTYAELTLQVVKESKIIIVIGTPAGVISDGHPAKAAIELAQKMKRPVNLIWGNGKVERR